MELTLPSADYKHQFLDFYNDFVMYDFKNSGYYSKCCDSFEAYVHELNDNAIPENASKEHVPYNTFWLVDSGRKVIGAVRLRHHIEHPFLAHEGGHIGYDIRPSYRGTGYGKRILSLVLERARNFGLRQVLVVADESNEASRRIIESNSGVFEGLVDSKISADRVARYWISLS